MLGLIIPLGTASALIAILAGVRSIGTGGLPGDDKPRPWLAAFMVLCMAATAIAAFAPK